LILAGLTLARGISGLFGSDSATYLDSANLMAVTGLLTVALVLTLPIGILMMNQQKMEADFTHGLCPTRAQRLYPELASGEEGGL